MSIVAVERTTALPEIAIEIPDHLSPQAKEVAELLKRRAGLALQHSKEYYAFAKAASTKYSIQLSWQSLGTSANNFSSAIKIFLPEFFKDPKDAVHFTKTIYDRTRYMPQSQWGEKAWELLNEKQQNHFRDLIRRIEFAALHSQDYTNAAKACSVGVERPEKVKLIQELYTLASKSQAFAVEGKLLLKALFENLEIDVSPLKNQKIILPMLALFTAGAWLYKRLGSTTQPTEA